MTEENKQLETELNLVELVDKVMNPPEGVFINAYLKPFCNKLNFIMQLTNYLIKHPAELDYKTIENQDWWDTRYNQLGKGGFVEGVEARDMAVPKKTIFEMIERIKKLEDKSLSSVIMNELKTVDMYNLGFQKAEEEIEIRYQTAMASLKKSKFLSSGVATELKAALVRERLNAKQANKPFITLYVLKQYSVEVNLAYFPTKIKVNASIEYDPAGWSLNRLEQLKQLKKNDGRTRKQRRADKTKERIDSGMIEMLESIVEHDPAEDVSNFARDMIRLYEINGSFKV
ncbi:hypothetical protein HOK51_00045 [Candidatus Woesearchaeota archaeon]|jgi:hypothetical protein|nr:hypothetical protein [Candidatus Woesearchaeota archaeon]MBT6518202.1 hypothetical protein [Candidatus Woesearchaeota archaeon]MBT7368529.1 hypothetical protein [Candidatus Woesearchaeota archaeon]